MRYLPDTNVLIRSVKSDTPEAKFIQKAIQQNKLVLSAVVIAEFLVKADPDEEEAINKLLLQFPIVNIDLETAKVAVFYRKNLLKSNRIVIVDCFIAAQAKLNSLTLVTNNKADFPMEDIKVIKP